MKLRTASLLAAACSALTLTLGTNAAVAASPDTDAGLDAATDIEAQAPDGDGGNPGLPEPAGVGAPQGLTAIGEWTITTTDAQGRTVQFGDLPGDVPDSTAEQQPSAMSAAGSWWDGQCGSNSGTANKFDVLKQYNRPKVHKRMEGSKSKMYCGKSVSTQSEAAFGLRHIPRQAQRAVRRPRRARRTRLGQLHALERQLGHQRTRMANRAERQPVLLPEAVRVP